MPYEDERAGLAAITSILEAGVVEDFRSQLVDRHTGTLVPLPPFAPPPSGTARRHVVAIDGSNIYVPIPGALPCTEAGIVSLGVVVIDTAKLNAITRLPASGSFDPRELKATEDGMPLGTILPGRNAAKMDGTGPRAWFRETICREMETARLGDETFLETLVALLGDERTIRGCPSEGCPYSETIAVTGEHAMPSCPTCGTSILPTDGLRIHEQFVENQTAAEAHARFRDALEILSLMNILRFLVKSEEGRRVIACTAFVLDGPLAAFGTVAVLAGAVRHELRRIQGALGEQGDLLVMSGVKSGPFVEHFAELDRAPEPGRRVPRGQVYLPDNAYVRENIIAPTSANGNEWGKLTYFGRPVLLKTSGGKRLVLNLAQPEADPPLTEAPIPACLGDALATADPLGVGDHQFEPLRRVHAQAAIPLRSGTDLIRSLARGGG